MKHLIKNNLNRGILRGEWIIAWWEYGCYTPKIPYTSCNFKMKTIIPNIAIPTVLGNCFGFLISAWIVGKAAIPPKQNKIIPKAKKNCSNPRSKPLISVNQQEEISFNIRSSDTTINQIWFQLSIIELFIFSSIIDYLIHNLQ